MQAVCMDHPTEAALESYLLNHAAEEQFDVVETHLLVCEQCIERAEDFQDFRDGLRDGFALLRKETEQRAEKAGSVTKSFLKRTWRFKWPALDSLPTWAFVPALGALLLGVLLIPGTRQPGSAPFDVSLTVMRGDESTPVIPAGRKIEFHLNLEGLGESPVAVEVVDSDGRPVGPTQALAGTGHASVQRPAFMAGTYFLRVYGTKDGQADQDHLLREFSFQAR